MKNMKKSIFIYLLLLCSISIFAQDVIAPPRTCTVCKVTKPASEFSGDSKTCKACAKKKPETKICSSCKKTKALNAFSGSSKTCKECVGKIEKQKERERQREEERKQEEAKKANQLGEDYFYGRNGKRKDYNEALKLFRQSAEQGNADGRLNLGEMYFSGYGVTKNDSEAVKWFRKSAEQGNAVSQCRLGLMYDMGWGVASDHNEAVNYYRKSAEQGYAVGQYSLGSMYYLGSGVTKDYNEAVKWYRKAAEQGDGMGQFLLASMYEKGEGVVKDLAQAVYWYKKSLNDETTKSVAEKALKKLAILEQEEKDLRDGKCVDLGLPSGTLWATCNLGASKPEEYGDYFAWGETKPKREYNFNTYIWCNNSHNSLTKYCTNKSFGNNGFIDGKTELDIADDAAYVNWGSDWRVPSYNQIKELVNYCNWKWTTINGIKGYEVKSRKNKNSIFLPAAGWRHDLKFDRAGTVILYWTRSLATNYDHPINAYRLGGNSEAVTSNEATSRDFGLTIRPVRVKP